MTSRSVSLHCPHSVPGSSSVRMSVTTSGRLSEVGVGCLAPQVRDLIPYYGLYTAYVRDLSLILYRLSGTDCFAQLDPQRHSSCM